MALTANAQWWMGAELGFWRDGDAKKTSFNIKPEVGYNVNQSWAIAMSLGYEFAKIDDFDPNHILTVNPYVRWSFVNFGPVTLFLDGGAHVSALKNSAGDSYTGWGVGIKPGVALSLGDHWGLVTHLGFLGYQSNDKNPALGKNGFGLDFSSNNLTFGAYYNF